MDNDGHRSMFQIFSSIKQGSGRLGQLLLRDPIPTPNFLGLSSRGAIPHITQDTFASLRSASGLYVALEDFIERAPRGTPPILDYDPSDGASPLRRFINQDDRTALVLGPRRVPPTPPPTHNTGTSLAIFTSVGFSQLSVSAYQDAVRHLRPDITVGLADIPHGASSVSQKRKETMTDRTTRWMQQQMDALPPTSPDSPAFFAPLLPLPAETQRWYLEDVVERLRSRVDGLVVYDTCCLPDIPTALHSLPRLGFTGPSSPQQILAEIALGIDLFTVPFIGAATDAGIALSFTFPRPMTVAEQCVQEGENDVLPMGIDMWLEQHEADVSPLTTSCDCYACSNHHKAYVRHLLTAKEMLGWTLLQIHNHRVLELFFNAVRESIQSGRFEEDRRSFEAKYAPALPAKTGQGPRVRGYQYKSEGPGEPKRNPVQYRSLDDGKEQLAEALESGITTKTSSIEAADMVKKFEQ